MSRYATPGALEAALDASLPGAARRTGWKAILSHRASAPRR